MSDKNTVLSLYFWMKMKSNVNNLEKEIESLTKNPNFIVQFMDEPYFQLSQQNTAVEKESALPNPSAVQDVSAFAKDVEPTLVFAPDRGLDKVLNRETEAPETGAVEDANWGGKVLVLTPQSPNESELALLLKVLSAVALADSDYVHINRSLKARELIAFESAKIILSFGAVTDFMPDHLVRSKQITVVISSPLSTLINDLDAKKKLWASMKAFFS